VSCKLDIFNARPRNFEDKGFEDKGYQVFFLADGVKAGVGTLKPVRGGCQTTTSMDSQIHDLAAR